MAREVEKLARQKAVLEAQLAAERDHAQSHGYSPTFRATPKPQQVCQPQVEQQHNTALGNSRHSIRQCCTVAACSRHRICSLYTKAVAYA